MRAFFGPKWQRWDCALGAALILVPCLARRTWAVSAVLSGLRAPCFELISDLLRVSYV